RDCPVCGAPPAATWFETQDGYRYVICAACQMVFIPEFLPPSAWDDYYAAIPDARDHLRRQLDASLSDEAVVRDRDRFGRYLAALRGHGAELVGARLLDIGSFTGASLRLAAGLMKPGAWLALTVPNARNVQFAVLREFCFFAYGGYHGIGHINMFSPESLRRALTAAGLELVHLSTEFGTDWRQLVYYLQ